MTIKRIGSSTLIITTATEPLVAAQLADWLKNIPEQATITVRVDPGDRPFDTTTTTRITANW